MTDKLQSISTEIKFYAEEITQAMYKSFIGEASVDEYTAVLKKFSPFFNWNIVSELKDVEWGEDDNSRALFLLRGYIIGQWYSFKSSDLMDKITQLQVKKNIPFNKKKISLREARNILQEEKDANLGTLRDIVTAKIRKDLNPVVFEYYNKLRLLSTKLGYSNFIDAANDIRRYRVQQLVTESEKYIKISDLIYNLKIENNCYKDGYDFFALDQLEHFSIKRGLNDIKYLFNQLEWSTSGIEIAWINSNQKYSKSFCVPMRIPGRIILVTSSADGYNSQRHLYHEFGHGFHFMNTNPKLKYEFRRMGDHAVAEAYSALIESLLFNKSWLFERGYPLKVALYAYYHRIYLIRKYWGKLKSELETHLNNNYNENSIFIFDKWYSRALNNKYDSTWWAFSLDDELNSASQIRAWLLYAQINEFLTKEFGDAWFKQKEAGAWLKELYFYGYKYNADEISKLIGYTHLNSDALIREFKVLVEG